MNLSHWLTNPFAVAWKAKLEAKRCPACGENKMHPEEVRNSLSRRDNKTMICNDCGMREALEDIKKSLNI